MLFFKNKIVDFITIGIVILSIFSICLYFIFSDEIAIYQAQKNDAFFRPDLSKKNRKKIQKANQDEVIRMNTALMNIDDEYRTYHIDQYGNIIVDGKIIGQKKDNKNGSIALLKNGTTIALDTSNKLVKSAELKGITNNQNLSQTQSQSTALKPKIQKPKKRSKYELVKKDGKSSFLPANFSVDKQGNIIDKNGKKINKLNKDVIYFIDKEGKKVFLNKDLYSFNKKKKISKPKPKKIIKPKLKPKSNVNTKIYITEKDLIYSQPPASKNTINKLYKAIIYTNQKIIHNQEVKILLLEDVILKNQKIYKNSVLYGIATINGSRYNIDIKRSVYNLINQPVFNAIVYDRNYMQGIFSSTLEDDIKKETTDGIIDNTTQEISNYNNYLGSLLNTSKQAVKKKKNLEDLALNVIDDYPIYIKFSPKD